LLEYSIAQERSTIGVESADGQLEQRTSRSIEQATPKDGFVAHRVLDREHEPCPSKSQKGRRESRTQKGSLEGSHPTDPMIEVHKDAPQGGVPATDVIEPGFDPEDLACANVSPLWACTVAQVRSQRQGDGNPGQSCDVTFSDCYRNPESAKEDQELSDLHAPINVTISFDLA
jgi:hypothetical protein